MRDKKGNVCKLTLMDPAKRQGPCLFCCSQDSKDLKTEPWVNKIGKKMGNESSLLENKTDDVEKKKHF